MPRDVVWLTFLVFAAGAHAFVGDVPRAKQLYGLLRPFANRLALSERAHAYITSVSHSLGLLATLLRRFEEAEVHFEEALNHHERLGSPPLVALTQAGYAQMLGARGGPGDEEPAEELRRRTHAIVSEFGMRLPDDEHWPVSLR